jgi:secretory carrier-associated membrane protein
MIIGIPSTGSAGLIQTVSMFSRGHIAAGILGVFATAGWTVQGLGNLFYYREVSHSFLAIT